MTQLHLFLCERPMPGDKGCTLDALHDWICERSRNCALAASCAKQEIGADADCLRVAHLCSVVRYHRSIGVIA